MISLPKIEPNTNFSGEMRMFEIDMDPALTSLWQDQHYDVFASLRTGDLMELPSLIFVETRFISKQRAEVEMAQQRLNPGREATISTLNYGPDLLPQVSITHFPYSAQNPSIYPLQNSATSVTPIRNSTLIPVRNPVPIAVNPIQNINPITLPNLVNQKRNVVPTTNFSTIGNQQEKYLPMKSVTIREVTPLPKPEPEKTYANATVMAGIATKEFGTMTDNKNPTRDREIQVQSVKTNSIAIQCCVEDDLDFETLDDMSTPNEQAEENELMKLKLYYCENSLCHSNGKVECRVCGEVQKSLKEMESHLLLHFGPKVLCYRCGIQCDNKFDLRKHPCEGKRILKSKHFRCPYYNCNAVAISSLELYDHINEHSYNQNYKCAACERRYFTVGEYQLHLKLNTKCSVQVKKPLRLPYAKKGLRTARDRLCRTRANIAYAFNSIRLMRISPLANKCRTYVMKHRCQVCLKVLSNGFKLRNHQKKCYLRYNVRYKWQCLKAEE